METEALRRVRETCARYGWLTQGSRVIVGLSGGSDSLCLLLFLKELSGETGASLLAVHVNHHIRGEAAEEDAAFCRSVCERLGVAFRLVDADVPAIAAQSGAGLEEAGRIVRYQAFEEIAEAENATLVAVAHHADDQAETVVWNLTRGAGLRGLRGIRPETLMNKVRIIRPLLTLTKKEILAELALRGQEYRTDATNLENDGSRNTIRNRVMPILAEINPRAGEHIAESAGRLADVWELVDSLAEEACGRLITGTALDTAGFCGLPKALRREVALRYAERVCGHRKDIAEEHLAMIERLCGGMVSAEASLPYGVTLVRTYGAVKPKPESDGGRGERECAGEESSFSEERLKDGVHVPWRWPGGDGIALSVFFLEESMKIPKNHCTKWFDYDKIGKAVTVRRRRAGDRVAIDTDGRTQTVQDLLVNAKVPAEIRDDIPILGAGDSPDVLWIAGVRGSEAWRVTEGTKRILEAKILREDGTGCGSESLRTDSSVK